MLPRGSDWSKISCDSMLLFENRLLPKQLCIRRSGRLWEGWNFCELYRLSHSYCIIITTYYTNIEVIRVVGVFKWVLGGCKASCVIRSKSAGTKNVYEFED